MAEDTKKVFIKLLQERLEKAAVKLATARKAVARQENIISSIENLINLEKGKLVTKPLKRTRWRMTDEILKIMLQISRPLSLKEILSELEIRGKASTTGSIGTMLAYDKRFKRTKHGVFYIATEQNIADDKQENKEEGEFKRQLIVT